LIPNVESKENQNFALCLKQKLVGKRLKVKHLVTLDGIPFGTLIPEQEWLSKVNIIVILFVNLFIILILFFFFEKKKNC